MPGWLVASIDQEARLHHGLIQSLDVLHAIPAKLALIDIPHHFADTTYRSCEVAAQALLGNKKRASIFLLHTGQPYTQPRMQRQTISIGYIPAKASQNKPGIYAEK